MNNEVYIRDAKISDAADLLKIYEYYVIDTAITFEYDVPSVEEFTQRIETVTKDFPYIVAVDSKTEKILGYAYASKFHERAAYQWCVEMSIYIDKEVRRGGLGRLLYSELERRLKEMGILNLNACIGYPNGKEDEYLTYDSVRFHEKMGYTMVGEFHECGFKFGRWYNMVWMEKLIGEHNESSV